MGAIASAVSLGAHFRLSFGLALAQSQWCIEKPSAPKWPLGFCSYFGLFLFFLLSFGLARSPR